MKKKLLKICKIIFGLGFIFIALWFFSQAYKIISVNSYEWVSLFMILLFLFLNINSTFYAIYIAKDKVIATGAILWVIWWITILWSMLYVS